MNGGAANVILDNLIAGNKAVPMVVVTTLGYGVNNGPAGAMAAESITGYTKSLLTEVMPAVERGYNVSRNREERAIAGLSMGGAETLYTALNNLDKFAWMGSFSGAFVMWPGAAAPPATGGPGAAPAGPPAGVAGDGRGRGASRTMDAGVFDKNFPNLDTKANSQIRLLWITCGTADSLIGVNRAVQRLAAFETRAVRRGGSTRYRSRLAAVAPEPHVVRAACVPTERQTLVSIRGASPLGLPYTRSRSPLRRLAPARVARSQVLARAVTCSQFMS